MGNVSNRATINVVYVKNMNERTVFVLREPADVRDLNAMFDVGWLVDRVDVSDMGLIYILIRYEYAPKK